MQLFVRGDKGDSRLSLLQQRDIFAPNDIAELLIEEEDDENRAFSSPLSGSSPTKIKSLTLTTRRSGKLKTFFRDTLGLKKKKRGGSTSRSTFDGEESDVGEDILLTKAAATEFENRIAAADEKSSLSSSSILSSLPPRRRKFQRARLSEPLLDCLDHPGWRLSELSVAHSEDGGDREEDDEHHHGRGSFRNSLGNVFASIMGNKKGGEKERDEDEGGESDTEEENDSPLSVNLNSDSIIGPERTLSRFPTGALRLPQILIDRNRSDSCQGYLSWKQPRWPGRWVRTLVKLRNGSLDLYVDQRSLSVLISEDSAVYRGYEIYPKKRRYQLAIIIFPNGVQSNDNQRWVFKADSEEKQDLWVRCIERVIAAKTWWASQELGPKLGDGATCDVKVCKDKETGARYAMKIVKVLSSSTPTDACGSALSPALQKAYREVDILKTLREANHRHILEFLGAFHQDDHLYIATPLYSGRDLFDYINPIRGRVGETRGRVIMSQLLSALDCLHSRLIVHLDVKPENIVLESEGPSLSLRLVDFGSARMYEKGIGVKIRTELPQGTIGYIAPECYGRGERYYTPACDVFAAGVTLYVLLVGYLPFFGATREMRERNVIGGYWDRQSPEFHRLSAEAKELIARMLACRPRDRISLQDARNHPWFRANSK